MSFKTFLNMNTSSPFNCAGDSNCCILKSKKIDTSIEFSNFFNRVVNIDFCLYHSIHVDIRSYWIGIINILLHKIKYCFEHSADDVVGDYNLLDNVFNLNVRFWFWTHNSFIIGTDSASFWVYLLLTRN